jgi:hypothetical protein
VPWELRAEGHADDPEDEKKLFRLLGKLFSEGSYGVVQPVTFIGSAVQGNPCSEVDLATAQKGEAEASLVPKGEPYPAKRAEEGGTG